MVFNVTGCVEGIVAVRPLRLDNISTNNHKEKLIKGLGDICNDEVKQLQGVEAARSKFGDCMANAKPKKEQQPLDEVKGMQCWSFLLRKAEQEEVERLHSQRARETRLTKGVLADAKKVIKMDTYDFTVLQSCVMKSDAELQKAKTDEQAKIKSAQENIQAIDEKQSLLHKIF